MGLEDTSGLQEGVLGNPGGPCSCLAPACPTFFTDLSNSGFRRRRSNTSRVLAGNKPKQKVAGDHPLSLVTCVVNSPGGGFCCHMPPAGVSTGPTGWRPSLGG